MAKSFYDLEVGFVSQEVGNAIEIGFILPEKFAVDFVFDPGQYLTLKVEVNGKVFRRAYSICSPTNKNTISVLVKRLEGGKVSNYLNDHVKAGDHIAVLAPGGHFKVDLTASKKGSYYLIGSGSGITPLLSIASSILQEDSTKVCHLLYGNRNEGSIIFKSKLNRLALVYPHRFSVEYILSQPKKNGSDGFLGVFSTPKQSWKGQTGRINENHITRFLNEHQSNSVMGYYICGPGKMIETSVTALEKIGVQKDLIHREYFTSAGIKLEEDINVHIERDEILRKVTVTLDGVDTEISMTSQSNIVAAMIKKGIEPPYSCLSGTCSTCMARLTQGEVKMDVRIGLEDEEAENGFILTCQSHPITDTIALSYDID